MFSSTAARALWYVGPMQAELREERVEPPLADESRLVMLASALSRGTERLIASGLVPEGERERMRCPHQAGDFPFPVKYGYCAVARVEEGPAELVGKRVFVLHPHQDAFNAKTAMLQLIPDDVPTPRATLAANMETALNAIWDSGMSAADRVTIVGGGLVGVLVTCLAARFPGAEVTLVDVNPARAAMAEAFGARFALPPEAPRHQDVVFHASASQPGLASAIASTAPNGTVIELSWYGEKPLMVPLGGHFHAGRVKLVSSQVGTVSPGHASRGWSYSSRLQAALRLLRDERLDALLTETLPFHALPDAIPRLLATDAQGLVTVVSY
ncbi:MAG: zinc-binding alcohol dehydrogenase [Methylobacterium sp.]|nr:zinc-binding alcohol dehydrogenase [Methylobacterium sp.]